MRAIAVLGVVAFHELLVQPRLRFGHWVTGGGVGVDIFFAISGFLITTLLLQEARDRGAIRFGAFYLRRVRRLLPALAVVLEVLVIASVFDGAHQRHQLLLRIVAAGGYVSNWVMATSQFNMDQLGHTWSLATEEQFYLVWPALLTGIIVLAGRVPRRAAVGIGIVTVVAFAWPQIALSRGWSFQRVYYGPDTRAAGLALGALLAALWTAGLLPKGPGWVAVRRLGAMLGLVFIVGVYHDVNFGEHLAHNLGLPRGRGQYGVFEVMALGTALIIWELLEALPHAGHRILAWRPLAAIGRVSYGVYLWDSLVVLALTPAIVGLHGWTLVAVHLAALAGAAGLSWWAVERHFLAPRRVRITT